MKTDVVSRGFDLTPALLNAVEAHAEEYRGRFQRLDINLTVRLFDINGERGGPDKCCLVCARLSPRGVEIISNSVDADLYLAIANAFAKTTRGTAAHLHRDRMRRRALRLRRVTPELIAETA